MMEQMHMLPVAEHEEPDVQRETASAQEQDMVVDEKAKAPEDHAERRQELLGKYKKLGERARTCIVDLLEFPGLMENVGPLVSGVLFGLHQVKIELSLPGADCESLELRLKADTARVNGAFYAKILAENRRAKVKEAKLAFTSKDAEASTTFNKDPEQYAEAA